MALGVAKPFSREWTVESVDNRRNHKIPRDQFRKNETGWNSLPERVNCLGFGMKRLRHQSRDKRNLIHGKYRKFDSLPTLVPIKNNKIQKGSN